MHYEGKIYRPWIEANSLLIQTTLGCTHNKCTFCDMFREKRFHVREIEDVMADIDEARDLYPHVPSVFLIDGNVMVLKTDYLHRILKKIKASFPECRKVSLYSQYNDFNRKSVDELKMLHEAGLSMAYAGLESGNAEVLRKTEKGMTPEEVIEGAAKAKEAGIRVLASFIFGLGGKERSREHIKETVRLLNITQPEEIAPMALAVQPGTKLDEQICSGEFIQAMPLQILQEEKYLLENMDFETFYWGDHGNNILTLKGHMPDCRQLFLNKVNLAIDRHPVTKAEVLRTYAW